MQNSTDPADTGLEIPDTRALARVEAAGVVFASPTGDGSRSGLERHQAGAPRIVVDAVGRSDRPVHLRRRLVHHFSTGAQLVWVLDAATRTVRIYRALETARVLTSDDVLDGEEVLPGFAVPVAELFDEADVIP